jgi:hypothetical protein
MKLKLFLIASAIVFSTKIFSQTEGQYKKYFVGSSLWSIANLFPEPADFYQLDFGYRFTQKDALIIEAITWKYDAPLGIPYGTSFEDTKEDYPGYIRAFGIGLDYQRMLWKQIFTTVHATPFLQKFYDLQNKKIQNGFQLFLQVRFGYHIELFKNRMYLEPSVAFNYWPVNTNLPASFKIKENQWNNYFLFEPGLNFGVNF